MDAKLVDELITCHSKNYRPTKTSSDFSNPMPNCKTSNQMNIVVSSSLGKIFGLKRRVSFLQKGNKLVNVIEQEDPNAERSSKVRKMLKNRWHSRK